MYSDEKCSFQFHFDFNTTQSHISLFFEGNTAAQSGNVVYATNLHYCKILIDKYSRSPFNGTVSLSMPTNSTMKLKYFFQILIFNLLVSYFCFHKFFIHMYRREEYF